MEKENKNNTIDYILLVLVGVSAILIIMSVWSDIQIEFGIDKAANIEFSTPTPLNDDNGIIITSTPPEDEVLAIPTNYSLEDEKYDDQGE